MEEEVRFRGEWLVAGADVRWPGQLTWSLTDGVVLDVEAKHGEVAWPPATDEFSLIYGETIDGKPITLVECVQTRANTHMPGGVEASFSARYAFVGAWFESLDELRFQRLAFRLSELDTWLGVSGFRAEVNVGGYTLEYRVPDWLEVGEADDVRIHAHFRTGGFQVVDPLVDVEFRQRARLQIVSPEPVPLSELAELVRQVRNFFSFAVREQTRLLEVTVRADVEIRRRGETRIEQRDLTVYYKADADPAPTRPVERTRMLFRYEDGRELAASPLSRWLAKRELLGPVYDLYLVGLYQPRIYLELQFLSLAQALESLHSRKFPDYDLPKAKHKERMKAVLASAPDEWRDWMKEKLGPANKASFRTGVTDLLATLPASVDNAITDAEALAARVGWTRNYLTHWNAELERKAVKGDELVRLTEALRLILEALLLLEVGFTKDEIDELIRRNSTVQRDIAWAFGAP